VLTFNRKTKESQLIRPTSDQDFVEVTRWAVQQLPNEEGTLNQIYSIVQENGWKELKRGTSREANICKNAVKLVLHKHFVGISQTDAGETIFACETVKISDQLRLIKGSKPNRRIRSHPETDIQEKEHDDDDLLPKKRVTRILTMTTDSQGAKDQIDDTTLQSDFVVHRKKRRKVHVSDSATQPQSISLAMENHTENHQNHPVEMQGTSGINELNHFEVVAEDELCSPSNNLKSRRWYRFACERHRKEHSKCPENCPWRNQQQCEEQHTQTTNSVISSI